jgi:hypothetical protein
VPGNPKECRRHAENCRRLAKTAPTSIRAAHFEELARRWLKVADDPEAYEAYLAELREAEKKAG